MPFSLITMFDRPHHLAPLTKVRPVRLRGSRIQVSVCERLGRPSPSASNLSQALGGFG